MAGNFTRRPYRAANIRMVVKMEVATDRIHDLSFSLANVIVKPPT